MGVWFSQDWWCEHATTNERPWKNRKRRLGTGFDQGRYWWRRKSNCYFQTGKARDDICINTLLFILRVCGRSRIPLLQVGDEVNPRRLFFLFLKFYRAVGNVTADTIKHYTKESQRKPKAEFQLCRLRKSDQRRLDDFWETSTRPAAYPLLSRLSDNYWK